MKLSEYYKAKLEAAAVYQDMVTDYLLHEKGVAVCQYCSRKYQFAKGESASGIEIKKDEKFNETGNLWIEVAEKSSPDVRYYTDSGILRSDNTWLYLIGDEKRFFIFIKNFLVQLHKSKKYDVLENNMKTSKGFLLPVADASRYGQQFLVPEPYRFV